MDKIQPIILAGGAGTRLWPYSRQAYPKQFLDLIGNKSLFQETCLRFVDPLYTAPNILGNEEHRFIAAEQMQNLGIKHQKIVLEPVGRNTAPAACIAALLAACDDPNQLLLLVPSDHFINDKSSFNRSIQQGIEAVERGQIVTFGVRPDAPETGYGYIETVEGTENPADVARFVEKPTLEEAQTYLDTGSYFWNAGIFMFTAKTMIEAFEAHAPEIIVFCNEALDKANSDHDFLRLNKEAYDQCPNISLDYAIMEKIDNIKCVPMEGAWSDLGSWPAVWQSLDKNKEGNVIRGDVILHDTRDSYVHVVDSTCLTVVGLDNIIAVATKDAILIAPKNRAQDVKVLVDKMRDQERKELISHSRVYRPWGWYEGLSTGERYQVKCLMVKPMAQISLQSHHHRAEHWVVVSGTVRVTNGEEVFLLTENESTYIPIGHKHRLENPGKVPALLIEVQSGSYLDEDDIVRYEDKYGREE